MNYTNEDIDITKKYTVELEKNLYGNPYGSKTFHFSIPVYVQLKELDPILAEDYNKKMENGLAEYRWALDYTTKLVDLKLVDRYSDNVYMLVKQKFPNLPRRNLTNEGMDIPYDNGVEIDITKKDKDERDPRPQSDQWSVSYVNGEYQLSGTIKQDVNSGNYEFSTDWFLDEESEEFYDDTYVEIETDIMSKFNSDMIKFESNVNESAILGYYLLEPIFSKISNFTKDYKNKKIFNKILLDLQKCKEKNCEITVEKTKGIFYKGSTTDPYNDYFKVYGDNVLFWIQDSQSSPIWIKKELKGTNRIESLQRIDTKTPPELLTTIKDIFYTKNLPESKIQESNDFESIPDYKFTTTEPLDTTAETMDKFLNDYFYEVFNNDAIVTDEDGSYAEVLDVDGKLWALHASGDGDFTNHRIRFELLNKNVSTNESIDTSNVDWNLIEQKLTEFSSTYSKADYPVIRQTFNFLKGILHK